MTVPVPDQLEYISNADGVTKDFPYPKRFLQKDEIVVLLRNADGIDMPQTLGTHYTIAGSSWPNGGTISFNVAPASGLKVVRYRMTQAKQTVDLKNNQRNDAPSVELQLDRMVMAVQDRDQLLNSTAGGLVAEIAARKEGDRLLNSRVDKEIIDRENGDKAIASLIGQAGDIEVPMYDTRLAVTIARIKPTVNAIRTGGYAAPGDGGAALYKRVESEPTHAGKVMSADGAWWELSEHIIRPEMFGGKGDGVSDDTLSLLASASIATYLHGIMLLSDKVFKFSRLNLTSFEGLTIQGRGVLLHDGSVVSGDIIALPKNSKIEALRLHHPGHENGVYDVRIGEYSSIKILENIATSQSRGEGVVSTGQDVYIGCLRTENIDRPLHIDNSQGVGLTTGFYLGTYAFNNYLRGFRLSATSHYHIGPGSMTGRSPNAINENPGYNSCLLTSAPNGTIGNAFWEDGGEHAFRIGGNVGADLVDTTDVQVGVLTIKRSSASAIKLNPDTNQLIKRIHFDAVIGVDIGFSTGTVAKRSDGLRLSHCRDVTFGTVSFVTEQLATSAEVAIRLNNAIGVHIDVLDARAVESGIMAIDESADVSNPATEAGPVRNISINKLISKKAIGNYPFSFQMPSFPYGNIYIGGLDVTGLEVGGLAAFSAGTTIDGDIIFSGRLEGSAAHNFSNLPATDFIKFDALVNGTRVVGPVRYATAAKASMLVVGEQFNPANNPNQLATLDLMTMGGTSALGAYGAGLAFHGAASSGRRRAGIAAKQTGLQGHEVGLAFFSNAGVAGSDALIEVFLMKAGGGVKAALPLFADNASALSGGLEKDEWYRTSTGEIRIVI